MIANLPILVTLTAMPEPLFDPASLNDDDLAELLSTLMLAGRGAAGRLLHHKHQQRANSAQLSTAFGDLEKRPAALAARILRDVEDELTRRRQASMDESLLDIVGRNVRAKGLPLTGAEIMSRTATVAKALLAQPGASIRRVVNDVVGEAPRDPRQP